MNKQKFIDSRVDEARAKCIGTRARAMFNADAVAAKAAEEWEFNNSSTQIERAAKIATLEAKGKLWVGSGGETRVYFNAIPVGTVGRTFDCYIDIESGELHGALTDEERAAAKSIIGDVE
jgi:hypothetical protein